jgi:hypothetical protein
VGDDLFGMGMFGCFGGEEGDDVMMDMDQSCFYLFVY